MELMKYLTSQHFISAQILHRMLCFSSFRQKQETTVKSGCNRTKNTTIFLLVMERHCHEKLGLIRSLTVLKL